MQHVGVGGDTLALTTALSAFRLSHSPLNPPSSGRHLSHAIHAGGHDNEENGAESIAQLGLLCTLLAARSMSATPARRPLPGRGCVPPRHTHTGDCSARICLINETCLGRISDGYCVSVNYRRGIQTAWYTNELSDEHY